MANFAQMLQKAQALKSRMAELQTGLLEMDVAGSSGDGAVHAVVNGRKQLKTLKLAAGIVNPAEVEILEDLIVAAVNDANAKAEQHAAGETKKIMDQLGLPPGMDLPF